MVVVVVNIEKSFNFFREMLKNTRLSDESMVIIIVQQNIAKLSAKMVRDSNSAQRFLRMKYCSFPRSSETQVWRCESLCM